MPSPLPITHRYNFVLLNRKFALQFQEKRASFGTCVCTKRRKKQKKPAIASLLRIPYITSLRLCVVREPTAAALPLLSFSTDAGRAARLCVPVCSMALTEFGATSQPRGAVPRLIVRKANSSCVEVQQLYQTFGSFAQSSQHKPQERHSGICKIQTIPSDFV